MIEFFLRRPIFAMVCSLIIVLAGIVAIPTLPVAQFPKVAPPVVTVQATYTGASATTVENSVTTILENAINGVQGLRYISSQSSNDGSSTITCTFDLERDLDLAANDVQNAINTVQARLPNEVKATGVSVSKNAGNFIMGMGFSSTDPSTTALDLSNYADLYIKNDLKRIPGVSDVLIFGERKYAMRVWLDPKKLADNGLAATDVTTAIADQNVQVAAGAIGQPPTDGHQPYQYSVRALGRLSTPAEFARDHRQKYAGRRPRVSARCGPGRRWAPRRIRRTCTSTGDRLRGSASWHCPAPTRWTFPSAFVPRWIGFPKSSRPGRTISSPST